METTTREGPYELNMLSSFQPGSLINLMMLLMDFCVVTMKWS